MNQDADGNLLETLENYNDLYSLTELHTNNKNNTSGPGVYHGKGLVLPGGVTPTVNVKLPSAGAYAANAVCQTTKDYPPFATSNQVNGKYPALYHPSLVSAVVANSAMETSADCTNPTVSKFGA